MKQPASLRGNFKFTEGLSRRNLATIASVKVSPQQGRNEIAREFFRNKFINSWFLRSVLSPREKKKLSSLSSGGIVRRRETSLIRACVHVANSCTRTDLVHARYQSSEGEFPLTGLKRRTRREPLIALHFRLTIVTIKTK